MLYGKTGHCQRKWTKGFQFYGTRPIRPADGCSTARTHQRYSGCFTEKMRIDREEIIKDGEKER